MAKGVRKALKDRAKDLLREVGKHLPNNSSLEIRKALNTSNGREALKKLELHNVKNDGQYATFLNAVSKETAKEISMTFGYDFVDRSRSVDRASDREIESFDFENLF